MPYSVALRVAQTRATVTRWLELGLPPLLPHAAKAVAERLPWKMLRDVLAEIGSAKAMRFTPLRPDEPADEHVANALGILRTMPELDGQDGRAALAGIDRRLAAALEQMRAHEQEGRAIAARLADLTDEAVQFGDGQDDAIGRLMRGFVQAAEGLERLFPRGPGGATPPERG